LVSNASASFLSTINQAERLLPYLTNSHFVPKPANWVLKKRTLNIQGQGTLTALSCSVPCTAGLAICVLGALGTTTPHCKAVAPWHERIRIIEGNLRRFTLQ